METKEYIAAWGWDADDQVLLDLDGAEILYADYDTSNWEGHAVVVWRKDGQLFEAGGSHCSCYGLEGQWEPEETSFEALNMRPYLQGKL